MNPNLRVIKTARTSEAINKAAQDGYQPLVKPVMPSPEITTKFAILQHPITGEIKSITDFRAEHLINEGMQKVIDFTYYYPYNFPSPYAAYLIPKDLQIGERVWLDDLIEDVVGQQWNQGDTFRLPSCEAVWDGKSFQVDHRYKHKSIVIG